MSDTKPTTPEYIGFFEVETEFVRATNMYGPFASPHEGYAIIKEELDELWAEVMKKPAIRSKERMREEAIQIAAMAIRFVEDICR